MNKKRKTIVVIACAAVFLCCLIPPWIYTFNSINLEHERPAGYSFVFIRLNPENNQRGFGIEIDYSKLAIQILGISILGGGLFFAAKDES